MSTVHPRACGEQILRDLHPHTDIGSSRACGEQVCLSGFEWIATGSSPRVRGTGNSGDRHERVHRFIPARAGNSRLTRYQDRYPAVHPRACGEQRYLTFRAALTAGSSPRVRGTVLRDLSRCCLGRFIPARAGNSW